MKFKSQVYTAVSGSIGGITYSHNKGGMYTRARATPTNPSSAAQLAARNAFGAMALRWRETLSTAQRNSWENYAALTPVTDKLGEPVLLSGQQMYIRNNTQRVRSGLATVDPGPIGGGGTPLTTPVLSVSDAATTFSLAYTNTDDWAGATGGGLLIQASRQMAPTINFFKAPFRFAAKVDGAGTPPTSPATPTSPFADTYSTGKRVYARCIAVSADGRISDAQIVTALVSP